MVESLAVTPDALVVCWDDGERTELPWVWVRDHSHDRRTLHPATRQRQIDIAAIEPSIRATAATVVGAEIVVDWATDDPQCRLPIDFVAGFRTDRIAVVTHAEPWDSATIRDQWPTVDHSEVMAGDDGVRRWLDLVARYGFCIVTGTPPDADATRELIEQVGYIRETIFGGFWEFRPDLTRADTAYTDVELPPHTDGTFSHDAPGLQILHCLEHDGEGGETVMVDGFRIADELRRTAPDHYATLATVEVPGQYIGDGAHLVARRPVLRHDRDATLVQVSFNNADRAPFLLAPDEMRAFYDAARAFETLARDPRLQWRRRNPPGDAMLFDNWRVLHGRTAFTGARRMCGAYVNREDFESRRRTLAPPDSLSTDPRECDHDA